jgi:hypothetical protein
VTDEEPTLTQDCLNRWTAYTEWLLDVQLSPAQSRQFQAFFADHWRTLDTDVRKRLLGEMSDGLPRRLSRLSSYERNALRAQRQPWFLKGLRQTEDECSQWLLAVHEAAHRPGGSRNPVLVPGTLPLTQDMVNSFGDYLEWILDLRKAGGLTAAERQELQTRLIGRWRQCDDADKVDLQEHLEDWQDIAQADDAERDRKQVEMQPGFVAFLRGTAGDAASAWMLRLYDRTRR